ncbi:MAG: hypothetical protein KJ621_08930 [Proteobacteria bacterium]|nr:hypothetical protein [Pseudomonadota bacterium]MBU1742811.1 hypothetical protein [Pseudomonadota bacterium]
MNSKPPDQKPDNDRLEKAVKEQAEAQLRRAFARFKRPVDLILLAEPGPNDVFAQATRQIVISTGQGAEAAMSIFEDLVNPYWTSRGA